MKDMGQLNWFLGCEVKQDLVNGTTTLVQTKYIHDLLARFDFIRDVAPAISPSGERPPTLHIPRESDAPNADEQQDWWRPLYRPLIGSLLYAAVLTRPDIAAEVAVLSQFLANPTQVHWDAAVRVLAYLKHTPERGITYSRRVDLPDSFNRLYLFVDATWADDKTDRKSTSGIICMLNGGPVSWKSKKQPIIAQSSCEAEIIAATAGANEAAFLRDLLEEIGCTQVPTRCYEDNQACRMIIENPGSLRERSKHFEIRFLKVAEYAQRGVIDVVQIPTKWQLADLLTKRVSPARHRFLCDLLLGTTFFNHQLYD